MQPMREDLSRAHEREREAEVNRVVKESLMLSTCTQVVVQKDEYYCNH